MDDRVNVLRRGEQARHVENLEARIGRRQEGRRGDEGLDCAEQHAVHHPRNGAELTRRIDLGLDLVADASLQVGGEQLLPLMLHVIDGGIGKLHDGLGRNRPR
jgi:hypothetical protein